MRSNIHLIHTTFLVCLIGSISAYPGREWAQKMKEIKARAAAPIDSPEDSYEMIGDLITLGPVTNVGQTVADIIVGKADGQSTQAGYNAPGALGTPECQRDTCCVWSYITADMTTAFKGDSGRCTALARGAIRLGFHDSAAWDKSMNYGGADGSMILTDEVSRTENRGLEEIVDQMRTWYNKYKVYGVGAADLVQFGANHATVTCPLGPRVRTFVGRYDSNQLPPEGLLPDVNGDADGILALFENKTIRPHGLTALLGAHTTSQQRFFNTSRALDPQDSTPGVWDVLFYNQTVNPYAPPRVLKFPSDVKLSQHPRVQSEWMAFTDPTSGQAHWGDDYAKEYVRLSLLGVYNINNLTECSQVLPPAQTTFNSSDSSQTNQWANGGFAPAGEALGQLINSGQEITNTSLQQAGINPNDSGNKNSQTSSSTSTQTLTTPVASVPIPVPFVSGLPVASSALGFLKGSLGKPLIKGVVTQASVSSEVPIPVTLAASLAAPIVTQPAQTQVAVPVTTVLVYTTVYKTDQCLPVSSPVVLASSKATSKAQKPHATQPPLVPVSSIIAVPPGSLPYPQSGSYLLPGPSAAFTPLPLPSNLPLPSLKSVLPSTVPTSVLVSAIPKSSVLPKTLTVSVSAVPKSILSSAVASIIPKPPVLSSAVASIVPSPPVLPSAGASIIPKPPVLPSAGVAVPLGQSIYPSPQPSIKPASAVPISNPTPKPSQVVPQPSQVAPKPSQVVPTPSLITAPAVVSSLLPVSTAIVSLQPSSLPWSGMSAIPSGWPFPWGRGGANGAAGFPVPPGEAIPSNFPQGGYTGGYPGGNFGGFGK